MLLLFMVPSLLLLWLFYFGIAVLVAVTDVGVVCGVSIVVVVVVIVGVIGVV